ncbi:TolC family protein [Ilyobacter polytropus]|uniref:Outer membrane efflux protein n=1 Tax=Ilyobacter polytropus (strain ATCC 51220 / DSM 2926 / LMG 16218 / CuHBu1) TaxID=572544 RepID=E3H7M6_ILYPC|nr:TolC family protein [Ilyobacter polytropus]ADO82608.1 outer membrane efflux protein [Ilyobacter polytropus DSM 2926]
MNKKKFIVAALLAVFARGYAEDMTLNDVLDRLEKSNREIMVQDMEIESLDLQKKKQFKNMLPSASIDWSNDFVDVTDEDQNDFGSGDSTSEVGVSIPLFRGGTLYNQYKKSTLDKENSKYERNLVSYEVQETAIATYFEVLNKRKQAEISRMVQNSLSKQEERLRSLYKSNKMIPKSELLKVQADLILTKSELTREIKEQRSAEETLLVLLDMPFNSDVTFTEDLSEELKIDMFDIDVDLERALKYGSKIKQEDIILENSGIDVKIAKGELYPTLDASASFRLDSVDDDESEYQVSLSASWEIFSWGSTLDDIKQKKINYNQAMTNYKNAVDTIALEVRNQYREMEILSEEVYSQKINLQLEEENMRIDKLRYENGIISTYDYLDSVSGLSTAQERYYSLQRDLLLAIRIYENLLR